MRTHRQMIEDLIEVLQEELKGDLDTDVSGLAFLHTSDGSRSMVVLKLEDPSLEAGLTAAYKHLVQCYTPIEARDVKDLVKEMPLVVAK